uniref:Uncharacterized protein n=1 Tax=Magallana gigas TaxID=29159 RepID=K1QH79_MAGGI
MRTFVFSLALLFLTFMVTAQAYSECPYGKPRVHCYVNPCEDWREQWNCANIPNARCVPDYCGGCYRRWYVGRMHVFEGMG